MAFVQRIVCTLYSDNSVFEALCVLDWAKFSGVNTDKCCERDMIYFSSDTLGLGMLFTLCYAFDLPNRQAVFSRLLFFISELDLSCLFRVLFGYISFGVLNTVASEKEGQRSIFPVFGWYVLFLPPSSRHNPKTCKLGW